MSGNMYLLWFDDTPRLTAAQRIQAGAARFRERFQLEPRIAVVNPTQAPGGDVDGLRVVTRPWLLKNNFWIGLEEPR